MTNAWAKLDADWGTNAKLYAAGRDGVVAFFALVALHSKYGSNGKIPASRVRPDAIALSHPAAHMSADEFALALRSAEKAQLVTAHQDGSYSMVGYDPSWMPRCTRCGSPNAEPTYSRCPRCRADDKRRRGAGQAQSHSAQRDNRPAGQDRTGQESSIQSAAQRAAQPARRSAPTAQVAPHAGPEAAPEVGSAPHPEPETRTEPLQGISPTSLPESHVGDPDRPADPAVALEQAMRVAGYREKVPVMAHTRRCKDLHEKSGLTAEHIDPLWQLAQDQADSNPAGLFATWVDKATWKDVLADAQLAVKEATLNARPSDEDQEIGNVYGEK